MIISISLENFRSFQQKESLWLLADEDAKTYKIDKNHITGDKSNTNIKYGINSVILNDSIDDSACTEIRKSALLYGANSSGKTNVILAMYFITSFLTTDEGDLKKANFFNKNYLENFFFNDQDTTISLIFALLDDEKPRIFEYTLVVTLQKNKADENIATIALESLAEICDNEEKKNIIKVYRELTNHTEYQTRIEITEEYFEQIISKSILNSMTIEKNQIINKDKQNKIREFLLPFMVAASTNNRSVVYELYSRVGADLPGKKTGKEGLCYKIIDFFKNKIVVLPKTILTNTLVASSVAYSDMVNNWSDDYKTTFSKIAGLDITDFFKSDNGNIYANVAIKASDNIDNIECHTLNPAQHFSYGTAQFAIYYYQLKQFIKNKGGVLIIDEIDSHFHTTLLLLLFEEINKMTAPVQIIATTHNASLLRYQDPLFMLDQLWLLEKRDDYSSKIVSMLDYQDAINKYMSEQQVAIQDKLQNNQLDEAMKCFNNLMIDLEALYLTGKIGGVSDIVYNGGLNLDDNEAK